MTLTDIWKKVFERGLATLHYQNVKLTTTMLITMAITLIMTMQSAIIVYKI